MPKTIVRSGPAAPERTKSRRNQDEWRLRAACRGPQAAVFFPPPEFERKDDKRERERRAKAICRTCAVLDQCRSYAVTIREPHGIWGGLNEFERRDEAAAST